jgi:hypothetical protein
MTSVRPQLVVSLFCSLCLALAACRQSAPPPELDALASASDAQEFILYSLDPIETAEPPPDAFHGWRVLGSVEVLDNETRQTLFAALAASVVESDSVAGCFNPRHGIRIVDDGKTTDYVICFECGATAVYSGSEDAGGFQIGESGTSTFNEIVDALKLPKPAPPY